MTIREYKIPEGSEDLVDAMVVRCVEDFLAQQMRGKPVEEKPEYQEAVDAFRAENDMEVKYEVKEEPMQEEVKPMQVEENIIK